MDEVSASTYHRWLGWHAPDVRRVVIALVVGLIVVVPLLFVQSWPQAILGGWDAAAVAFLVPAWHLIRQADAGGTRHLSIREDAHRDVARLMLLTASIASLGAVAVALGQATTRTGREQATLVVMATLTVVLSWIVLNTVFTLRYARLYYEAPNASIEFQQASPAEQPDYRDFAYFAFTIGMTYQVSDTVLRDRGVRRTVLVHSLVSYVYGVVIVSTGVSLVAGLLG